MLQPLLRTRWTCPNAHTERWTTSEGNLTIAVDEYAFSGTYESDTGHLAARLVEGVWQGFWAEDGSSEECGVELLGTRHWGRISFTFDEKRTHFEGNWSYCDKPTDGGGGWTGDRAP